MSAWLAEAARQRVRNLLLGKFVAELMEEHGWTEADLEAAAKEARATSRSTVMRSSRATPARSRRWSARRDVVSVRAV